VTRLCLVGLAATLVAGGCGPASHQAAATATRPRIVVTHRNGYGSLKVEAAGKMRTLYRSNDSCCTNVVIASPTLVAFDDDYNVKTVDLRTGHVSRIAGFSNFVVSPDGLWVAGWSYGPFEAEQVGVVSITGNRCLRVPKPGWADDWSPYFSPDSKRVDYMQRRFDETIGEDRGPAQDLSVALGKLPRC
jgi:tricorn protease-like protein